MSSFMDEVRKIPPVTRFLCASTLGVTLPVMLGLLSPLKIVFSKDLVTRGFEIWRPFTSMFYAGTGINAIIEFAMLYRNSDSLESSHYSGRSADFAWQLLLNAFGLLALNLPLHSWLHFQPFILSLTTLHARLSPNELTSIFGLVTFSHKYLPYALVGLYLVTGGPKAAANALTGVISGYAWWYLVHSDEAGRPGAEFARAPAWLQSLIGGRGERVVPGVGQVLNAGGARAAAAGRATARTAMGGYNWGTGHRLGEN
ncbi:DER1-domain-containing protein [Phellopilus nigrolimitatus]|nr:DER1-domain-containing protein [Phellopilus nigrolimitatus]